MKVTDDLLYHYAPMVDDAMSNCLLNNSKNNPHYFSIQFEKNSRKIIKNERKGYYSNDSRRKIKKIVAAALCLFVVGGSGLIANAATNSALWNYIKGICFGTVSGAHSTFYYSSTEQLDLSDFPDGAYLATVKYCGEGKYEFEDGTQAPFDKLIFFDNDEMYAEGDMIDVIVIP